MKILSTLIFFLSLCITNVFATSTMTFSYSIIPSCIISTSPLNFGSYTFANISADLESSITISANCDVGANYSLLFSNGNNYQSPNNRLTDGAGHFVDYSLYKDSARTQNIVGNNSTTINSVGTGDAQNFTIYGSVMKGQNMPAGTYADTITVTFAIN